MEKSITIVVIFLFEVNGLIYIYIFKMVKLLKMDLKHILSLKLI
jgi:hypothetical protein